MHALAEQGVRAEMAAFLLALNPELTTARNVNGLTPLHWAGNELPQTIELILDNGADPDAQDKNGYAPLHHWTRWWMELLIFDYTDWGAMPQTPGMVNGRVRGPEEPQPGLGG